MADPGSSSAIISQISHSSGLGPYALDSKILEKLPFSAAYADGETLRYTVTDTSGMIEATEGMFTSSVMPNTLSRVSLLLSTTGSFISWPSTGQRIVTPLVSLSSMIKVRRVPQGSTTTLSITLDYLLLVVTGTLAGTIVNGPNSVPTTGTRFEIKDKVGNPDLYPIVFTPALSQTVEGETTYSLNQPYGSVVLTWDGVEWSVS